MEPTNNYCIRKIEPTDNASMASIIRTALTEFGANKPGTVYYDETTDHLFELFENNPLSYYCILTINHKMVGGAGIFPTQNLPIQMCELVKMYLSKHARGLGFGRILIEHCINKAIELGYTKMYLETLPELSKAVTLYEKMGFEKLTNSLGNSGHTGCNIWMLKTIA